MLGTFLDEPDVPDAKTQFGSQGFSEFADDLRHVPTAFFVGHGCLLLGDSGTFLKNRINNEERREPLFITLSFKLTALY